MGCRNTKPALPVISDASSQPASKAGVSSTSASKIPQLNASDEKENVSPQSQSGELEIKNNEDDTIKPQLITKRSSSDSDDEDATAAENRAQPQPLPKIEKMPSTRSRGWSLRHSSQVDYPPLAKNQSHGMCNC